MGITTRQENKRALTRTRNRAARERALMSAASKLFAARGFEATTTREIAFEARCAEGLIHRYFHGKAGLLFALVRFKVSQALSKMNAELQPGSNLEQEMMNLVDFELKRMWEDREFFRVVIPCAISDRSIGQSALGPSRRARDIGARLKSLQDCRQRSDRDIESMAYFVSAIGLMFGFIYPAVLRDGRSRSRELAMSITETFIRGLSANNRQ